MRLSFPVSGKRHLLITGSRGAGKSTLLQGLLPEAALRITTWAEPGQGVYLRFGQQGEAVRIGTFDPSLPGPENRMSPEGEALAKAAAQLDRLAMQPGEWAVIDEIGYLECTCESYCRSLLSLLEHKRVLAAVRRQALPFLGQLLGREDAFAVDLDAPFGTSGCVIMASGLGQRFGSNKLLADFHGQPLVCRALEATEGLFARRLVVTRHRQVAALCGEQGVECVLHDLPDRSDTVRLGLEALGHMERCLFCPGDQPLLRRDTVAALLLCAQHGPDAVWRPAFEGSPGAPVLFPAWAFPELLALPTGMGGGYVVKKHPERVRLLPVRDAYELMDADTPGALRRLAEHR